jgi:undecaprenyl-diphosphatase
MLAPSASSDVTTHTMLVLVLGSMGLALFAALLVAVVTGSTGWYDSTAQLAALAARTPSVNLLATMVTGLGSFPVLVGVAVLTSAGLWLRTRRLAPPTLIFLGLGIVACTVYLLKIAVGRPRPSTLALIGNPSSDYSFPSGHTANGTVTWLLAALLLTVGLRAAIRRAAITAAAVVSISIGLSRVYLGYHWLSDVIAGWLLGSTAVCFTVIVGWLDLTTAPVTRAVRSRRASRTNLDPLSQPGAGVEPFATSHDHTTSAES